EKGQKGHQCDWKCEHYGPESWREYPWITITSPGSSGSYRAVGSKTYLWKEEEPEEPTSQRKNPQLKTWEDGSGMMKQEIPLSGMTEKSESSVPKKKERTGKEDWYDPAIREEEQPGTHILLKNIL